MGFFDMFKRKKHQGHVLDEFDRNISLQTRQINAQIRQQKAQLELEKLKLEAEVQRAQLQAELEEARAALADMVDDDDDDATANDASTAIYTTLLTRVLGGVSQPQPQEFVAQPPAKRVYSNAEIESIIAKYPKATRKAAAKLPDDALVAEIRRNFSDADDESIARAILLIRK